LICIFENGIPSQALFNIPNAQLHDISFGESHCVSYEWTDRQTDLVQLTAEFRSSVPEVPGVEIENKQVILKFVIV
jgi:trehalose-6-phosphatase